MKFCNMSDTRYDKWNKKLDNLRNNLNTKHKKKHIQTNKFYTYIKNVTKKVQTKKRELGFNYGQTNKTIYTGH